MTELKPQKPKQRYSSILLITLFVCSQLIEIKTFKTHKQTSDGTCKSDSMVSKFGDKTEYWISFKVN